jgi:hypothetical protein
VTAVLWIAEVIAPSIVALAILGDAVRPGWELPAVLAGLVTVGAAVLLAGASGHEVSADQPDALTAAPQRLAIAASAQPARDPHAERIIWWGAPPIWRPPQRARAAAVAARPRAELEWTPPPRVQPIWAQPPVPDADADQVPAPARRPAPVETPAPEPAWPAPARPWQDI